MQERYTTMTGAGVSTVLRPLTYQYVRLQLARLVEAQSPSEGLYYLVLTPTGWEPYSYRFDEFPELDHPELWEDYVAPVLAHRWAAKLKRPASVLEKNLAYHPFAFPRGRVGGKPWKVFHGKDTPKGISRALIQRLFTLPPSTKWELDDHEQCQKVDRDDVRALLNIRETWPAVSWDDF